MRLRILAASLAPLLAASIAHAQAPGEVITQPVVVAPVVAQPVVVAPVVAQPVVAAPGIVPVAAPEGGCAPARASVMANRWAIGLSVGSMSLAPKGSPDDKTDFGVGELALRFRATPHLELELTAGGGRERTADNQDGDLAVTTVALAARYRFRPEAAWNWFVMGGLGAASVTRHDATDQERHDATQPLGTLGIGLERRFQHLAIQAELRAIGLGKATHPQADPPMAQAADASAMPVTTTTSDPIERTGGLFSIGLSYYF